jgi:hypothetical protein
VEERREERGERGETSCKLTAGSDTRNSVRETSEPCINCK